MAESTVDLPLPSIGPPGATGPLRLDLTWNGREYTVWMVDVGLACCSVEVMAAALGGSASRHRGMLAHGDVGRAADLLVVSGTCTDALAPALTRLYDRMPDPKAVVSFGACSNSGGPYWDSYCVTKGIDQVIPVDVYVPGCPPRPEALLEGLALLEQLRSAGAGRAP